MLQLGYYTSTGHIVNGAIGFLFFVVIPIIAFYAVFYGWTFPYLFSVGRKRFGFGLLLGFIPAAYFFLAFNAWLGSIDGRSFFAWAMLMLSERWHWMIDTVAVWINIGQIPVAFLIMGALIGIWRWRNKE